MKNLNTNKIYAKTIAKSFAKIDELFKTSRMSFILIFYFACILENFVIRLILTVREFSGLNSPIADSLKIFIFGWYNDTTNFTYFAIPMALYLTFVPNKFYKSQFQNILTHLFCLIIIAVYSFQAHAEWFFWTEFSTRFNFIAVDYLVYTKEVLGNIRESYPMHLVYSSVLFFAIMVYLLFFKLLKKIDYKNHYEAFNHRLKSGLIIFVFPLTSFFVFENFFRKVSDNQMVNELSYNGLFQLFHAFRHNELDYYSFYKTLDDKKVWNLMAQKLLGKKISAVSNTDGVPYIRHIAEDGPEKKYNVMFVAVESLAASFMKEFGNNQNITPVLDALTKKSLFFSNVYATGNRTIRGMEALTLSIPPTPGYSIVKRPHNENLFSIGKVFNDRGFETKFIYGGYGYFDNMNAFFAGNNFEIVDRTNFKKEDYLMANIWGVDDESLFNRAILEADKSFKEHKPFFSFVMTTSNHRPFTYPEGRIDIPSHTSREGAVKYTDFAIGKFLKDAESKPWFHNTIFVIVADHGVGGRGATEIPMELYHIPFFIYSPLHVKPEIVTKIASQIDVAPTLLSVMNFSYDSKFFGKNILEMTPDEERAVLGTYSSLGFYSKGTLVSLGVNRSVSFNRYDPIERKTLKEKASPNQDVLDEAIGYYQQASYVWQNGLYNSEVKREVKK
jgi:phosphoglycerol transferase MdoB-like AlkP superfamily enzyme